MDSPRPVGTETSVSIIGAGVAELEEEALILSRLSFPNAGCGILKPVESPQQFGEGLLR